MKDVLATSLAEQQCKLVRAPVGSGSFFYALLQGGDADLSMQELRRVAGCPEPQEAHPASYLAKQAV